MNYPIAALSVILLTSSSPSQSQASGTLGSSSLPSTVKEEIAKVVMSEIADTGETDSARQNRIALESQITLLHLRPVGPPAIQVDPSDAAHLCAPNGNGNCSFWIFQQVDGHAVLLFDDSAEGVAVLDTVHNGMRDIAMTSRDGHTPIDEVRVVFHFDGKAYQEAVCSEEITGGDEAEEIRVPPHPCNTKGHRVIVRKGAH